MHLIITRDSVKFCKKTVYFAQKTQRKETLYLCLVGRWQGGYKRLETGDDFDVDM